jgi:hypothetical protein
MEYTREQAVRMFKEFQYFKLKSCGVKIVPELNKWEEDFLNVKFPKLEVGKWYKSKVEKWSKVLIYITDITDSWIYFFGHDTDDSSSWIEEGRLTKKNENLFEFSPATDDEVVEMLTKEAKKRYKTGDTIVSTYNGELYELDIIFSYHLKKTDKGVFSYGYEVMRHGKWAEVVEEETYFIGDRFEIEGQEYILSRINNKLCLLINLSNGYYYENPIPVKDINKITKGELGKMIGGDEFFNKVTKIK